MITSYVNPQKSLIYLSLLGPLDEHSANDLVNEYYERQTPVLRHCILDLSGAECADGSGLNVLHRISLLTQVDNIEFSVVARGSPVADEIAASAERFWVTVVDNAQVPFVPRRAS